MPNLLPPTVLLGLSKNCNGHCRNNKHIFSLVAYTRGSCTSSHIHKQKVPTCAPCIVDTVVVWHRTTKIGSKRHQLHPRCCRCSTYRQTGRAHPPQQPTTTKHDISNDAKNQRQPDHLVALPDGLACLKATVEPAPEVLRHHVAVEVRVSHHGVLDDGAHVALGGTGCDTQTLQQTEPTATGRSLRVLPLRVSLAARMNVVSAQEKKRAEESQCERVAHQKVNSGDSPALRCCGLFINTEAPFCRCTFRVQFSI